MTCMSSLTGMAKSRPSLFFAKVITALEMLHANLPPTLTTSQVSSVRKHLKNQLLSLLKSGVSENLIEKFLVNAFTLLTDLGASKDDVSKAMPNFEAIMKRSKKKKSEESSTSGGPKAKKAKIDIPDDDDESSEDDETEEGKSLQVNLKFFLVFENIEINPIFSGFRRGHHRKIHQRSFGPCISHGTSNPLYSQYPFINTSTIFQLLHSNR